MVSDQTIALKNIIRGGEQYRYIRNQIYANVSATTTEIQLDLNAYLREKLLKLRKTDWVALSFGEKDWKNLKEIRRAPNAHVEAFYLELLISYITENSEIVQKMYDQGLRISSAILDSDEEKLVKEVSSFSKSNTQSLFAFKTLCAAITPSEESRNFLKEKFKTEWLRKRFFFPLLHHTLNNPSEQYLDSFLAYVTTGDEDDSERATIRFLLRDEAFSDENLIFKSYIALLCHPYDACEIILNHIEMEYCQHSCINSSMNKILKKLSKSIKSTRVNSILSMTMNEELGFDGEPDCRNLVDKYGFSNTAVSKISAIISTKEYQIIGQPSNTEPLELLAQMRANKYPTTDEYNTILSLARKWHFLDAGKILISILNSLFLLPRRDYFWETREILRLIQYIGKCCPFIACSPSGLVSYERKLFIPANLQQFKVECDEYILDSEIYNDRMWINATHWYLYESERNLRVGDWLHGVRKKIRIAPLFLTGIKWSWIDQIIKEIRLGPFLGNPDAYYALLLMQIEEQERDPTVLRTAMEPQTKGKTVDQVVDWLIQEYGEEASAFVRYFLTPHILILSRLAPNETAAIVGRVNALDKCFRQFRSNKYISESLFLEESRVLTTSILLKKVKDGQFEIPWEIFKKDVYQNQKDLYETTNSLIQFDGKTPLLTDAMVFTPHMFVNGQLVEYKLKNSLWPHAHLILTIIDDFLQHPSFGLEVLLSTRFRHDTFRREVMRIVQETKDVIIPGVSIDTQDKLVNFLCTSISTNTKTWLNNRVQSLNSEKPKGLFNLVPNQDELKALVEKVDSSDQFEKVIDTLLDWLKTKLDHQLDYAKSIFESEFDSKLIHGMDLSKAELVKSESFRLSDIEDVHNALVNALKRKTKELAQWFTSGNANQWHPLSFLEVKTTADGVFEGYNFSSYINENNTLFNRMISPEKVRLSFNLLCEVFENVNKNATGNCKKVRIKPFKKGKTIGLIFSNLAHNSESKKFGVEGKKYKSEDEELFHEGNSGLSKIASLAATLIDEDTEIFVLKKLRSFHLLVPFWTGD
ncbi:MAG: hypothetical protein H6912_03225 [Kordiimonadaceae bacterium]|nr:hypothetical protein [Kordiimonadaceae bacterium]